MKQDHLGGDYRDSHSSTGYGARYSKTYERGYYSAIWTGVESHILREILRNQVERGAESALDFACGTGRITGLTSEYFPEAKGVDVSDPMLSVARIQFPETRFIQRDLTLNPLDETFDVITAFRFFLNAQPALRAEVLAALREMLTPGGRLIANVHVNSASPLGVAYRTRNRVKRRVTANTLSHHEFSRSLDSAGLEIESTVWYGYLPRPGWALSSAVERLVLPVERFAVRTNAPQRLAQHFVTVVKRKDSPP